LNIIFHFKTKIMNSNTILTSDVLDILFDQRNKNYGAYTLRKFYPERIKVSLFIMLGFAAAFSAFTLLPKTKVIDGGIEKKAEILLTKLVDMPKEIEQPKEQTPPPAQKTPTLQFTNRFTFVNEHERPTELNNIDNAAIGTITDTSSVTITYQPPVAGDGPGITTAPPAPPVETEADPIDNPDVQPAYPGGPDALRRFLEKNLQSPEDISDAVRVKIKFVVGNDGNLESFDIVQSGGEEFNKEVIRVLKKMPQWNAGKKGGRSVKVYCYLPVTFAPNE
jgi:periplasmic protein TonB